MKLSRTIKTLKVAMSRIKEWWLECKKEVLLMEAMNTDRGREMLAEALAKPIRERLQREMVS